MEESSKDSLSADLEHTCTPPPPNGPGVSTTESEEYGRGSHEILHEMNKQCGTADFCPYWSVNRLHCNQKNAKLVLLEDSLKIYLS